MLTWNDVVEAMLQSARLPRQGASARTLVLIAQQWPLAFPDGLREDQAQYMLDNPHDEAGDVEYH